MCSNEPHDQQYANVHVNNGELFITSDHLTERMPVSRVLDAFAFDPEGLMASTGVKFSRRTLVPNIRMSGLAPDEIVAEVVVKKAEKYFPIPSMSTTGIVVNGRWFALDEDSIAAIHEVLVSHRIELDAKVSLGRYLEIKSDAAASTLIIDEVRIPSHAASWIENENFSALGLAKSLYPYQQVGADFLVALARRGVGALLADQMGLGKTAQAIALILSQQDQGPTLIVCPASLGTNWIREFDEFAPGITVLLHSGPYRAGISRGLLGYDVVITSYETLVQDIGFMTEVSWQLVVLDEAQNIRNPGTKRAEKVKLLNRRVSLAITGTPIENRLLDTWSILEFVMPSLLGRQDEFEDVFPDELDKANALGQLISPVLLRRLVSEVAKDLPSLIQHPVPLELDAGNRALYEETLSTAVSPFAATTLLRVICAHSHEGGFDSSYSKISRTIEIISEIFENGQKVLLFASYQNIMDELYSYISENFPAAFIGIIDGRMLPEERQQAIDMYSNFNGHGILLLNPQAAGVGLNITSANHVIHFNPEWNPALTAQATARSYRRRQNLPVTVHHLYYVDSIEEEAINRAEWKLALANEMDNGSSMGER